MPNHDRIVHAKALQIAKLAVRATTAAGTGHPTTAMSLAHLTTVLMYQAMRWDPEKPDHRGSDRLVLSEGHAVPIVYAACADIGVTFYPGGKAKIMDEADLMTLRDIKSPIDGHPNPPVGFPLFDAATGSLGQGLSVAAGLAAAARIDKSEKLIYCIIGDGESREGQIWEAFDFAADHKLTNLIAIFNCNLIGQSDWVSGAQGPEHLAAKAEAFGWKVTIIDGHNPAQIREALKLQSEAAICGKPLCIVARTVKGWGAASQQGMGHHGTPVAAKDLDKVLAELDKTGEDLGVKGVTEDEMHTVLRIRPALHAPEHHGARKALSFKEAVEAAKLTDAVNTKKMLSPRRAFGLALSALGTSNPNVVALDADVKNSTYAQDFAKAHPSHFLECRIAEQNMVSVGAGVASGGKIPFISTFGKFFSRAFDQIEMAVIGGNNIKLVGTHIGVTLAADGPSQMATADVPFMRGIGHVKDHRGVPAMTTLTPADAVSAYKMVLEMADHPSSCYLRALRADVAILYDETDLFPFGGHKVVRKAATGKKSLVLVTNGYLVHTALAAAKKLAEAGLEVCLVDAYCLPMETSAILHLAEAHGSKILTVEDNYLGGLSAEIAEAAAKVGKITVESMAVRNLPKSGKTAEDVLAYCHLAESDIVATVTKLIG